MRDLTVKVPPLSAPQYAVRRYACSPVAVARWSWGVGARNSDLKAQTAVCSKTNLNPAMPSSIGPS